MTRSSTIHSAIFALFAALAMLVIVFAVSFGSSAHAGHTPQCLQEAHNLWLHRVILKGEEHTGLLKCDFVFITPRPKVMGKEQLLRVCNTMLYPFLPATRAKYVWNKHYRTWGIKCVYQLKYIYGHSEPDAALLPLPEAPTDGR